MHSNDDKHNDMEVTGIPPGLTLSDADINIIPSMAAMSLMESHPVEITADTFWSGGSTMGTLLGERKIYAYFQSGNTRRYAAVTHDDCGYIYLHHFKDEVPKKLGYCLIQYSDLIKPESASPRKVFLDLNICGTSLGKMHIHLSDSKAAGQFFVLCTGEIGSSYANTRFLQVWERNLDKEYVVCGDYEFNNGSGGKAIIKGLGDGEEYNRPWLAGTVFGFLLWQRVAGQFCILTRDNPNIVLSAPAFGMVVKGLDILHNILDLQGDIRDLCVADCGVVLYPSDQE